MRQDNYEYLESIRHKRLMERKRQKEEARAADEGGIDAVSPIDGARAYISALRRSLRIAFPAALGDCDVDDDDAHSCPFLDRESQILGLFADDQPGD